LVAAVKWLLGKIVSEMTSNVLLMLNDAVMYWVSCAVFVCSLGPPPAPSRLHKYYDNDDGISEYSHELKDYGGFETDQRRSYRSSDSPSSMGCRNGRYMSPGAHDDVFMDRCEAKCQPDWDANSRSGYKSSDDRTSSRGGT